MTLVIKKYSHNFAIYEPQDRYVAIINEFAVRYLQQIQYRKLWNNKRVIANRKMFASKRQYPLEYRMHIGHLSEFIIYLGEKGIKDYQIIEVPMYEPAKAEFKIITDKKPRNMQPEIIQYLVEPGKKKVVELQPGAGKTLCTLFAVHEIKQRAILSIKPMYIERWKDDVIKKDGVFHLKPHECTVIQGSQALANVIRMALDDELTYKFIIISNKTLFNYYKDYVTGEDMEKYFNVPPYKLMEVLKIGVRIIDEAHQDFHQCFKTDLFSHVPKTIELSATLTPDDPFLQRMYEIVYPRETRMGGGYIRKYTDVISVPYRLDFDPKHKFRTSQRGMTQYSHGATEESIMKSKPRLEKFLFMVNDLTEKFFIQKRYTDHKLLIFASRVEMCQIIVDYLLDLYPQYKISKYTQEEDYQVVKDNDIIVSTPISSGTAIDIPRLQVCINTVAIGSTQANLQMFGRLRELRDAPVQPLFIYLYCVDIEKHVEYHVKKRDHILKDRALSYLDLTPIKYRI